MKLKHCTTIAVLAIVIVAVIIFATRNQQKTTNPYTYNGPYANGVSYSPRSLAPQNQGDFYQDVEELGDAITWYGDWAELDGFSSGAKTIVAEAGKRDLFPVVGIANFNNSTGELLRPDSPKQNQEYIEAARKFAKEYDIPIFIVGVEINILARTNAQAYSNFVLLFDQTYDAIKEVSPNTRIAVTLQLEQTMGLKGGLFGGKNDPNNNEWDLLKDFPKADIVGLTTYPHIIFDDPEDMPQDYYSQISNHTNKPIAFAEVGWASNMNLPGHNTTPEEQANFLKIFKDQVAPLDVELIIWSFVNDSFLQDTSYPEPFLSVGLRDADGNKKPAYDVFATF